MVTTVVRQIGFGTVPLNSTTAVIVVVVAVGVPGWTATQRENPGYAEIVRRFPLPVQSVGKVPDDPSKLRLAMLP
jgi:hypothetical protein